MSYVFLFLILLFLARKIAKTHTILAQNLGKINADVKCIRYVFFNFDFNISTRKISKTHIILVENLRENNANFR
jgi:hypothetical protein